MKPYYQDEAVTIYHGDCREVLPQLNDVVDLVLTDPPYGIGIVGQKGQIGGHNAGLARTYSPVTGDDRPFDPSWLLSLDIPLVLWGANYYADKLPPSSGWLVWDKVNGGGSSSFADCEMAWTNRAKPARIKRHLWRGMIAHEEIGEERWHPTQKPIAVMCWCLSLYPDADTILDPYMGSGTTLRAAKNLGRKAIGIEIEERYCEIAAKRMSQMVLL